MIKSSLVVETLVVGQMDTNCYLLIDFSSKEALIIDPGDDTQYISDHILTRQVKTKAILATHGHFDHTLAALGLQLAFKIPFLINQADSFLLNRQDETATYFLKLRHVDPPPVVDGFLKEGQIITLGAHKLKVIHTPGHTPGSVCLYLSGDETLFAGDLLFADKAVGRTDFAYGSSNDLRQSLAKIFKLPGNTKIYPGHGRPTTINQEKF